MNEPFDPLLLLQESGVSALTAFSSVQTVTAALRTYVVSLNGAKPLDVEAARAAALRECKAHKVRNGREMVLAAFREREKEAPKPTTGAVFLGDPQPDSTPQNGAAVLSELADWLMAYVYLPRHAAYAVALWIAATWFVGVADFAPVLVLISATKRCGKTLLLHLVSLVVRRGYRTSGVGVTSAVMFRLNEKFRPTLCIDEAEKLGGKDADKEMIGLLNDGYRLGAKVPRCVERGGDFEIVQFDAFGFRALASIKAPWDTILDRAVVIPLERKPSGAKVRRFAGRVVEAESAPLAQRLARWSADIALQVKEDLLTVPRPDWLHDRACDNWATLFAVAEAAGGEWPARAEEAARAVEGSSQAIDPTEILVHDVHRLWDSEEWGEAIASGDLVQKLNELETSPWGGWGKAGKGLTTHALAALFRSLKVRPRVGRADTGVVRGYWYADLEPVFERYPLPVPLEVLQVEQPLQASPGADSLVAVASPGADSGVLQASPDAAYPVTPVTAVTLGAEGGGEAGRPRMSRGGKSACTRSGDRAEAELRARLDAGHTVLCDDCRLPVSSGSGLIYIRSHVMTGEMLVEHGACHDARVPSARFAGGAT